MILRPINQCNQNAKEYRVHSHVKRAARGLEKSIVRLNVRFVNSSEYPQGYAEQQHENACRLLLN